MTDLVTMGWLTTDDLVLPGGRFTGVVGGGALYAAVGAQIWNHAVAINAVTGRPGFQKVHDAIAARGFVTEGITTIEGDGLQLWLLHENEAEKQQVPKLASSTQADMDAGRASLPLSLRAARGFHVAPQGAAAALATLRELTGYGPGPVVTLDIQADAFVDPALYKRLAFLDQLTAFLPSQAEVEQIWAPPDLRRWMREHVLAHGCHLVVKRGSQGALLCSAPDAHFHVVPAYPARVVDTTGAGDAFCGGVLAGLAASRSLLDSALMGTVSASYVVEACGALATARPARDERDRRLARVRDGVRAG